MPLFENYCCVPWPLYFLCKDTVKNSGSGRPKSHGSWSCSRYFHYVKYPEMGLPVTGPFRDRLIESHLHLSLLVHNISTCFGWVPTYTIVSFIHIYIYIYIYIYSIFHDLPITIWENRGWSDPELTWLLGESPSGTVKTPTWFFLKLSMFDGVITVVVKSQLSYLVGPIATPFKLLYMTYHSLLYMPIA